VTANESQRKPRGWWDSPTWCACPGRLCGVLCSRQLVVSSDAAQTALNIVTHERLFRLGIASNLVAFALDVALITSLYVVLESVNRASP
jgi:hypothetical protein